MTYVDVYLYFNMFKIIYASSILFGTVAGNRVMFILTFWKMKVFRVMQGVIFFTRAKHCSTTLTIND